MPTGLAKSDNIDDHELACEDALEITLRSEGESGSACNTNRATSSGRLRRSSVSNSDCSAGVSMLS